ncbi:MAG TPA: hypothetical protein VF984_08180 [Actinomycetota bacterium]
MIGRTLVVGAVGLTIALPACSTAGSSVPSCEREGNETVLAAQAVPSATLIPCVDSLPAGWTFAGSRSTNGLAEFWLDSDRAGIRALSVTLTSTCDTSRAVEITAAAPRPGVRIFEEPLSLPPHFQADRFATFPGGCVTYRFRFTTDAPATVALEVDQGLGFVTRERVAGAVRRLGLTLCGAGAPPCPG